ncbi:MAG: transglutaminase domain-containing protein [Lachnospira sp.]|nr:transglutaminase domain-containing protein [Lachnospira sp.]
MDKETNKGKKKTNSLVMIILCVTVVMVLLFGGLIYILSGVKTDIVVEAGSKIKAKDIWKGGMRPALTIESIDTSVIGQHSCKVKIMGIFSATVEVSVVDTVAPKVAVKDVETGYNNTCEPDAFVLNCDDATEVVYSYVKVPDFTQVGVQNIIINALDAAGNSVNVATKLTVKPVSDTITIEVGQGMPAASEFVSSKNSTAEYVVTPNATQLSMIGRCNVKIRVDGVTYDAAILVVDTTPPVINTSRIEVILNSNVSYKKEIDVKDNFDVAAAITLDIDNSKVNLNSVGSYILTCTATDSSGNRAKKDINVDVIDSRTVAHTQAEIDKYADQVLAKIIKPGMTAKEKAQAIYTYTRSNISYKVKREKGDWLQGAYDGLVSKNGDCFTFCATAKALLTRAGIKNSVIQKEVTANTSQTNHYWNIIDIGGGWYHFDTTPRMDGTQFFMWTDAKLKEYSDANRGSHNFTRSKYPTLK